MLSIIQIVSCLLFCIIIKSQNTNSSTSASQVNIPEREVIIKGNYFFNQQDGSRFFIKGLVYQHRFEIDVDPLTLDESLCNYYAKLTSDIGANAVLVYSIDAKKDHSQCMNIFKKYKIQVVLGMNTIATRDEKMNSVYGVDDYSSMELIVQEFLKYSNFMGFIAGFESKELLKSEDNYETSLSISKAIIRDTKGIIKEQSKNVKGLKSLPIIGLSVRSDLKQKLDSYTNYFTCPEDNSDTRPDFISFSSLNMCNKLKLPNSVDFDTFPWNSYPVPLFFSEIGCDDSDTRTFDMVICNL
ncbi:hypothetical protein K502DRAFT_102203 [Neoconidiobolus thromboides FSU 785]|nr:hypothetical protein K502DRAFT_102203 [Neoconidiobolus thromboides FSU 785]